MTLFTWLLGILRIRVAPIPRDEVQTILEKQTRQFEALDKELKR